MPDVSISAHTEHPKQSPRQTNMVCLLPNTAIKVERWAPHPCGGWYVHEAWCYGPHGRIGYWMEDA